MKLGPTEGWLGSGWDLLFKREWSDLLSLYVIIPFVVWLALTVLVVKLYFMIVEHYTKVWVLSCEDLRPKAS